MLIPRSGKDVLHLYGKRGGEDVVEGVRVPVGPHYSGVDPKVVLINFTILQNKTSLALHAVCAYVFVCLLLLILMSTAQNYTKTIIRRRRSKY